MPIHAITLLTFLLLLASLALSHAVTRGRLLSPLVFFFGVWMVGLLGYELNRIVDVFVFPLTAQTEWLLALSFACVFMGGVVGLAPLRTIRPSPTEIRRDQLTPLTWATFLLLPLFAGGVLWKLAVAWQHYGSVFQNLSAIRLGASLGDLAFPAPTRVLTLLGYVATMNLAILIMIRRTRVAMIALTAVILLSFLNDITIAARGSTFNTVLLLASSVLVERSVRGRGTGIRDALLGLAIVAGGLLLVNVILSLRSPEPSGYFSRLTTDGYLYLTGVIPAMSYFAEYPWPVTLPAQWTLAGVYQMAGMAAEVLAGTSRVSELYGTFYAPVTMAGPFNSTAYLSYLHADGGEIGIVLGSFLMGFVGSYTFARVLTSTSLWTLQVATLITSLMVFSIRGILTNGVMFWVTLTVLFLQWSVIAGSRAPHSG